MARFTNPRWYISSPCRKGRTSIANAWYAQVWLMKGSWRLSDSTALQEGRSRRHRERTQRSPEKAQLRLGVGPWCADYMPDPQPTRPIPKIVIWGNDDVLKTASSSKMAMGVTLMKAKCSNTELTEEQRQLFRVPDLFRSKYQISVGTEYLVLVQELQPQRKGK